MSANLIRKYSNKTPRWLLKLFGNLWLPFLGAGIRIAEISSDYHYMKVCLKRSWFNQNYVGTQFGGSMYAMTDPFYMIMLLQILGPKYIVWDKGGTIDFKKPGRTKLTVEFRLSKEQVAEIKQTADSQEKHIFELPADIYDVDKNIIASVKKTLYVKKK